MFPLVKVFLLLSSFRSFNQTNQMNEKHKFHFDSEYVTIIKDQIISAVKTNSTAWTHTGLILIMSKRLKLLFPSSATPLKDRSWFSEHSEMESVQPLYTSIHTHSGTAAETFLVRDRHTPPRHTYRHTHVSFIEMLQYCRPFQCRLSQHTLCSSTIW